MKYADSIDLNKVMESYSYTYDKNDNIKSKTVVNNYPAKDSDKINETKEYTYDALGRLTKTDTTKNTTGKKSSITYGYDKVGNRTSMTKDGSTTAYSYNKLNQLTKSTETKDGKETLNKAYTYDSNGNQTKEKDSVTNVTVENTYDVDNRLSTSITVNGTNEVVNQENLYNGNGKRIQKKEGNNVVNYFYQDGVVLYTTDKDGNKTSQNFIGNGGNIIGTTRYSTEGFKYYTYNKDIQGSTTSVVGQNGTSPVAYDYDDFGVTRSKGDTTFFNEVCYTGGIYDVSTSLYYLNARYYDPNNSRFITQDTYRGEVNNPSTLHLYTYCANNPINYTDLSGYSLTGILTLSDYNIMHKIVQKKYAEKIKNNKRHNVVIERYVRKYKNKFKRGYLDIYDITSHSYYEVKTQKTCQRRMPQVRRQMDSYSNGAVGISKRWGVWSSFKNNPSKGKYSYSGKFEYGVYDVTYSMREKGLISYNPVYNKKRAQEVLSTGLIVVGGLIVSAIVPVPFSPVAALL